MTYVNETKNAAPVYENKIKNTADTSAVVDIAVVDKAVVDREENYINEEKHTTVYTNETKNA